MLVSAALTLHIIDVIHSVFIMAVYTIAPAHRFSHAF